MTGEKKCYKVHSYSPEDLKNALHDIGGGCSISSTANKYKIPKSTLHAKYTGKTPEECHEGRKTNLKAEEENRIEKWILHKAKLGFPMHPDEVTHAVQKVLQDAPRPNTFVNNKPGKKWLDLFLKRHPKLTIKNPEAISRGRASVTEENLRDWYSGVESHLNELGWIDILKKPGSIFNGDEIGMQLCPQIGRLLGGKGEKDFYTISSGKEQETITVLCTFSAAGDALPPMIMLPYKRIPAHLVESVPDDWPIGRSDSGWMVSSTFYEYIANVFYPWCIKSKVEFPVIYFLDGHKSHLTLELSDFCIKHDIILYALYPNSTHTTQPCDVAIFRALKYKWKEVIRRHKQKTQKNVTRAGFAALFKEAFDQIEKETITNGFRVCGLYPFDANGVNYDKCISKRRKDINNEGTEKNGRESTSFLTTDDLLSTRKFFNHVLGEKKIHEFEEIKHQNVLCGNPVYELWKRCNDELNMVPLVNDITNVIQKDNENSADLQGFNVISIIDLPVITDLEDSTYAESHIGNISSVDEVENSLKIFNKEQSIPFDIGDDEINFISCDYIDNINHCDYGAIKSPKSEEDSLNNKILSDTLDNIEVCDYLDNCNSNNSNISNDKRISHVSSQIIGKDQCENESKDLNKRTCTGNDSIIMIKPLTNSNASNTTKTIEQIWDQHLSWPEVGEMKKNKKIIKEKLPFAITAPKWREYHKKLRLDKEKKELETKEKAPKRKIKKEEDEIKKQRKKEERNNIKCVQR